MKKMIRVLLVEDDAVQADWIQMNLGRAYDSKLQWVATESQFRDELSKIIESPPDIVIMDVMLSWAEASTSIPAQPDDVRQEGMYRAGLRCQDLLSANAATAAVPVILYTVQSFKDLEVELDEVSGRVLYLPKEADINPLINQIDTLIA